MTKGLWIAACAEDEKADSVIAVVGEKIIRHYPRMVGDAGSRTKSYQHRAKFAMSPSQGFWFSRQGGQPDFADDGYSWISTVLDSITTSAL
jgi:hypothetical protein